MNLKSIYSKRSHTAGEYAATNDFIFMVNSHGPVDVEKEVIGSKVEYI